MVALAAALGVYACGSDGIVLPEDSVPAEIVVLSGDAQFGQAGSTLGEALEVRVTDSRGRPVADQEVTFTIELGGGQVVPATVRTDADGHAASNWTLGPAAGLQRARAQAVGTQDVAVSFTATALSGTGSTLTMVSGDEQTGQVNAALPEPLVVRVVDPLGNPVSGQAITWSVTGGSIEPTTSTTDQNGEASAERVLGPTAGTQSAQASAEGLAGSPVVFTHTAQASAPASLVKVSGDGQTAPAGFQLPESLVVQLRDGNGNGVAGRTVTWVVSSGSGVVSPLNSQTDEDGYAVTRWTLGPAAGAHALNAVFSGLPSVPFTATATADVPAALEMVSGDGQAGPAGSILPNPLRVKVTDANDNPVENVTVTWTAQVGGSVSSSTTGTNAQGIAEVSRTLGATPGTYTTLAAVDGLAGSPVTFTSTANVGPPAKLAWLTQPSGALVGQLLGTIEVEVQDAQGNRVPGATNQVTITSSVTGTLSGDNSESAVAGVASFTTLRLREAGTGYRLTALASGLASATSDPFDIAKGATSIDITSRSPTSSVTGQSVTINFDVDVTTPASGNLTGNVTVSDGVQSCTAGTTNAGAGSCAIAFATAGLRTLVATYADDPNFEGSASGGVSHNVGKANVSLTITSALPDPSGIGEEVTVEYSVAAGGGGAAPSGNVTVTAAGGLETCSATAAAGSCKITLLTAGSRTLTATYPGDDNYNGDTDTEAHSVRVATTTTVATSDGGTVFGESVTFTATVAPVAPGTGAPPGSVQFRAGGVDLGGPVAVTPGVNSSTASRSTSGLAVGSHLITAEYLPTGTTYAGSSGTLSPNQQVDKAGTTTTITGDSPDRSDPGQEYTVSVTVAALAPGGGTPGGTVAVSDGEGGSCQVSLAGGSGSCQLSTATSGPKTITATYAGDESFLGSGDTEAHTVNSAPDANPDTYSGISTLPIVRTALDGVLTNDDPVDGDPLSAVLVSPPTSGSLSTFGADGSFTYVPGSAFVTDTFTYFATDGSLDSDTVTVTLQIGP